jgi:hypothetical protein
MARYAGVDLTTTFPPQNGQPAHIGFSLEGLQALAAENPFSGRELSAPSREEISDFVVRLITANNSALFLDFQLLDRRCDELLARLLELELLTGLADDLASTPSEEGSTAPSSDRE